MVQDGLITLEKVRVVRYAATVARGYGPADAAIDSAGAVDDWPWSPGIDARHATTLTA